MKLIIKNANDVAELVEILINNGYILKVEAKEETLNIYAREVEYIVEVINADK